MRKFTVKSAVVSHPEYSQTVINHAEHIPEKRPAYGIQETIELLHNLPFEGAREIIPVVAATLESANVDLPSIITDAEQHEELLENRSIELLTKIEALETRLSKLANEIMRINDGLQEITRVKNLMKLALSSQQRNRRPGAEQTIINSRIVSDVPAGVEPDATFEQYRASLR